MKVSLRVFNTLAELRNPSATPPAADIRSCMPSSTHIHSFPNEALRQASSRFYLRQLLIDARAIQPAQPIAYHCTAFNIRRLLSIKHAFVHTHPSGHVFNHYSTAARLLACHCAVWGARLSLWSVVGVRWTMEGVVRIVKRQRYA